jgi:hypothetical protein
MSELTSESASVLTEPSEISALDSEAFQNYLRKNLTSDLVLDVLEELLYQENSTYAAIDFEQALKDLQQRDGARYLLLKTLLEGFAIKEGQVLLDPKLVNASYKQRVKELELLKSMGRWRRFFYRVTQAMLSLFQEKTRTEEIQEAITITGELQMARDEIKVTETQMIKLKNEINRLQEEASQEIASTKIRAVAEAYEKSEQIFKTERELLANERKALDTRRDNDIRALEETRESDQRHLEAQREALERHRREQIKEVTALIEQKSRLQNEMVEVQLKLRKLRQDAQFPHFTMTPDNVIASERFTPEFARERDKSYLDNPYLSPIEAARLARQETEEKLLRLHRRGRDETKV